MNVIMTLADRIGRKTLAVAKERTKAEYKRKKIELMQAEVDGIEAGIVQKEAEIETLSELKVEATALMKSRKKLQAYTDELLERYNAIEWSPEMEWSDKIESTDYAEKIAERHEVNARLTEIETMANKIYYRR